MEETKMTMGERVEAGTFILNFSKGSIRTKGRVKRERIEKMAEALRNPEPETVAEMAVDAADDLHVTKELLKVEEIRSIIAELNGIGTLLRSKAQPGTRLLLKGGLYPYTYPRVAWAESVIKAAQERIDALLDALAPRYREIIAEDEARLKPLGLFDRDDYPTLDTIREKTRLRYSWVRFSVPGELKTMSPEVFKAEREKAREMWTETAEVVRLAQVEALDQFIGKLMLALTPGEDGKRKVLQQRALDSINDWLREFALDDVTDYVELREKVDKMKRVLNGIDAEVLRTEEKARERVMTQLGALGDAIAPLVMTQQRRVKLRD